MKMKQQNEDIKQTIQKIYQDANIQYPKKLLDREIYLFQYFQLQNNNNKEELKLVSEYIEIKQIEIKQMKNEINFYKKIDAFSLFSFILSILFMITCFNLYQENTRLKLKKNIEEHITTTIVK